VQWEAADHSDVGESSLFCGGYPDGHFTCERSKTGRRLPQVFLAARGFDGEGCGALSFAQILCGGRLQTPITLREDAARNRRRRRLPQMFFGQSWALSGVELCGWFF
jgi:hypothetical protein